MKKTILILFAFSIAVVNSEAQPKKDAPKSPEQRTEKIINKLNEVLVLNDVQKPKVKSIVLKREQTKTELHKKFANDKEGFKNANKANMKAYATDLKQMLTPEQFEKLKAHRESMKQKRKEKKAAQDDKDDDLVEIDG